MPDVAVHPLFVGPEFRTQVWATEEVLQAIVDYMEAHGDDADKYMDKVRYYAQAGFDRHEGSRRGIRPKSTWRGVLAIEPWKTLFRLYGFYEPPRKEHFIIVSTTFKKGQRMRGKDKQEAKYAARVLEADNWKKVIANNG